jgi:NADH-quinone oxidoreductase subunit H
MLAERNRLPYDFLEGESELVSGFNTEFWGGFFSFLFIYEYGAMLLFAILTGYFLFRGVFSFIIFLLIIYFFLWIRSRVPRFRYDFLIDLAWKKDFIFNYKNIYLFYFFVKKKKKKNLFLLGFYMP